MKFRNAFTMVELIFVIVILGILGAVAISKFIGVSEESHAAVCKSAIGTMNRTIGLNLWSKSLSEGKDGDINLSEADMDKQFSNYNKSNCGTLVDLNVSDLALADGIYGSPKLVSDGNMTNAPYWIWVEK